MGLCAYSDRECMIKYLQYATRSYIQILTECAIYTIEYQHSNTNTQILCCGGVCWLMRSYGYADIGLSFYRRYGSMYTCRQVCDHRNAMLAAK